MDDSDNLFSDLHINPTARLPGWCAVAQPMVRSISGNLARLHWLQPCERQDLEQELWLELLLRHASRGHDDRLLSSRDAHTYRSALQSQLHVELQRIGAALVWSWDLGKRLRAVTERYAVGPTLGGSIAGGAHGSPRRRDLSLDVIATVAALPVRERSLCESIMAGGSAPSSDDSECARQLAALRDHFSTFIPDLR